MSDIGLKCDDVAVVEGGAVFSGGDIYGTCENGEVFFSTGQVRLRSVDAMRRQGHQMEFKRICHAQRRQYPEFGVGLTGFQTGDVFRAGHVEFFILGVFTAEQGVKVNIEGADDLPEGADGGVDLVGFDLGKHRFGYSACHSQSIQSQVLFAPFPFEIVPDDREVRKKFFFVHNVEKMLKYIEFLG